MPKITELPTDTAPDAADLVPFVDVTASRTEAVTVANLAAASSFSTAYAPLVLDEIWIPAVVFDPSSGSPAIANVPTSLTPVLDFDKDAAEKATTTVKLPPNWDATITVVIWWLQTSGSGDVRWRFSHSFIASGGAGGPSPTAVAVVGTGAASNVVATTTMSSSIAVTADSYMSINVERDATNVADTLTVDARLIGVQLIRNP